jgi:hypothetical protein
VLIVWFNVIWAKPNLQSGSNLNGEPTIVKEIRGHPHSVWEDQPSKKIAFRQGPWLPNQKRHVVGHLR